MSIVENDTSKELLFLDDEITTLILCTSRYLEHLAEELQAYPDEKPNPKELRQIAKQIVQIADIRELCFNVRQEKQVLRITQEDKTIL